ncbi:MAG: nucleoside hydrolase [Candidatus Hydrogenedentes bacterium]|nr:nucleoside hydrolase [Candidatus Hydrogenedentota bacterium]
MTCSIFSGLFLLFAVSQPVDGTPAPKTPIVYTTDLYHPHDDPDDHYDLATLFAMPEFDIRAIVIDCGERGKERPGIPAIKQMEKLTGRQVPYAVGLTANLRDLDDDGTSQPAEDQKGVELILSVLRDSDKPVTIFATGSMRDVAAAYNRAPDLFRTKLGRIYMNAGNTNGKDIEWNVSLDVNSYRRILESGLPIYWVPCFGTETRQSFWVFRQSDVLDRVRPELQQFFIYALDKTPVVDDGPVKALTAPIRSEAKSKWWPQERNMWCTAAFLDAAGRKGKTFDFAPAMFRLEPDGKTALVTEGGMSVPTIRILDPKGYAEEMKSVLQSLLSSL